MSDQAAIGLCLRIRNAILFGKMVEKLTSRPAQADFARFNAAADLFGADRRVLAAQVDETIFNRNRGIASLPGLLELLEKEIA